MDFTDDTDSRKKGQWHIRDIRVIRGCFFRLDAADGCAGFFVVPPRFGCGLRPRCGIPIQGPRPRVTSCDGRTTTTLVADTSCVYAD